MSIVAVGGFFAGIAIVATVRKSYGIIQKKKRMDYLQAYAFPEIIAMDIKSHFGVGEEAAHIMLGAMRNLFEVYLAVEPKTIKAVPRPDERVDYAWRKFSEMDEVYREFSQAAFGKYLPYTPRSQFFSE